MKKNEKEIALARESLFFSENGTATDSRRRDLRSTDPTVYVNFQRGMFQGINICLSSAMFQILDCVGENSG